MFILSFGAYCYSYLLQYSLEENELKVLSEVLGIINH